MDLLQKNDSIIMRFKPATNQWGLNDENIHHVDPDSYETILHNYCIFIRSTPFEVFEYLVTNKALDLSQRDENNETPIHIALRHFRPDNDNDVKIVQYLLHQNNLNINTKDKDGRSLLHWATFNLESLPIALFEWLIESQGGDINLPDDDSDTPLHYAFRYSNTAFFNNDIDVIIKTLLYLLHFKNFDVNRKGYLGDTLLHLVCRFVNVLPFDTFKYLVETLHGDVNILNTYTDTPLLVSLRNFQPENGATNTLNYLFTRNGLDVRSKDRKSGSTLLHWACRYINSLSLDTFKYLIETCGSDLCAQDLTKNTPIKLALKTFRTDRGGDVNILTYLLRQNDLNVNHKDLRGFTLFHIACQTIDSLPLEVFKYMIETKGADVNIPNQHNLTPFHLAMLHFNPTPSSVEILAYLLGLNVIDVNIKGQYGRTLFHSACEQINTLPIDIFKDMIETKRANMNVQDDYNDTPVHIAFSRFSSEYGDLSTLIYLVNLNGININVNGNYGQTLLQLVCKESHSDAHKLDSHGSEIAEQLIAKLIHKFIQGNGPE
jgi:ankyrin repeat protein